MLRFRVFASLSHSPCIFFHVWADVTPCRYICLFSLNDRPVLLPSLSGNGSSLTAVQNGISIDTSMGMTPLEGWVRAKVTVLLLYLCVAPRPALSPIIIRGPAPPPPPHTPPSPLSLQGADGHASRGHGPRGGAAPADPARPAPPSPTPLCPCRVLMGTRAGDMDPAVVLHLQTQLGLSVKEADGLLNKRSGLQGVCGQSDLRAVIEMAGRGEPRGALALDMFVYRIRKYIGAYMAALGGRIDAIVFSAGIGENSALARALVCQGLQASVPHPGGWEGWEDAEAERAVRGKCAALGWGGMIADAEAGPRNLPA